MYRNVASKIALFFFDVTTGLAKTGDAANLTAYVSKDGGAVTVLADTSAAEMEATNAKGWYQFDLAQGETDAVDLLFTAKSTTANISCVGRPVTTDPSNFSLQSIDGNGRVDVIKIAGTTQTARDIGLNVLLSSGTGTGQLDITAGVAKANAVQWLGGTIPAVNVTGVPLIDLKYTLGTISPATAGSVRADTLTDKTGFSLTSGERTAIANEVEAQIIDETDSEKVLTAITDKIASVNPDLGGLTVAAIASASATSVWSAGTRRLTDGTNIVLAKGVGVTGFNDLSAAQVNAEADTALTDYDGPTNAELATALGTADDAVLAAIAALPQDKLGYALTSAYDFAKGTVAMTEGYAADGATMTPVQAFYMVWALLAERGMVGTTLTASKLDGTTPAMTFTLDDATNPTDQTRAT